MITTSQKDGMYAPPAALGPKRQQIWGTLPDSATWLWKIRPASARKQVDLVGDPRTAGSMNQKIGNSSRSATSVIRMIFSTVRRPRSRLSRLGHWRPRGLAVPEPGRDR